MRMTQHPTRTKRMLALEVVPIVSIAKHYRIPFTRAERALLWAPFIKAPIAEEDISLWRDACTKIRTFYYLHQFYDDVERVQEFEDQIRNLNALGDPGSPSVIAAQHFAAFPKGSPGFNDSETPSITAAESESQEDYDIVSLTSSGSSGGPDIEHASHAVVELVKTTQEEIKQDGPLYSSSINIESIAARLISLEDAFSGESTSDIYEDRIKLLEPNMSQANEPIAALKAASATHQSHLQTQSGKITQLEDFDKDFEEKLMVALGSLELDKVADLAEEVNEVSAGQRALAKKTDAFIHQTSIREINRTLMRIGQNPLPLPGLSGNFNPNGVTWSDKEWSDHMPSQIHAIPVDLLDKWLDHYNLGGATSLESLKCKDKRKLLRQFIGQRF
ncbi:hypothetical protein IAU59_005223 [Kwoniella sp. CBS 9459]